MSLSPGGLRDLILRDDDKKGNGEDWLDLSYLLKTNCLKGFRVFYFPITSTQGLQQGEGVLDSIRWFLGRYRSGILGLSWRHEKGETLGQSPGLGGGGSLVVDRLFSPLVIYPTQTTSRGRGCRVHDRLYELWGACGPWGFLLPPLRPSPLMRTKLLQKDSWGILAGTSTHEDWIYL